MKSIYSFIQHIQKDQYFGYTATVLGAIFILYLNITYWQSSVVGFLFTGIYVGIVVAWLQKSIGYVFDLSKGWALVYALFVHIFLSSLFLAIPIALLRYTTGSMLLVLFVVALIAKSLLYLPKIKAYELVEKDSVLAQAPRVGYALPVYVRMLLLPLVFIIIGFLLRARTGEFILSPWEVISRLHLYAYLLFTALTGLLLFTKRHGAVLLGVIIMHSFVLHAYLPLVYETGFGGDKWRHIASERLIMTGAVYQPSLLGDREITQFGSLSIPAVFISGNKTSYAHQWAMTIGTAQMLSVDVFYVDFWLMLFLWSFFLPLLLYRLALLIRPGRTSALVFAFLPSLFYPMQVFGAITLPLSIGHLLFLFAMYGWLLWLKKQKKLLLIWNIALFLLMYFGYVLYWLVLGIVMVLIGMQVLEKHIKIKQVKMLFSVLGVIGLMSVVPALELFQGYGSLKTEVMSFSGSFSALADAFGELSGLIAFLPQTGHVDQGNFLFNQTRSDHAPVSFLQVHLWPLFFTVLIWVLIVAGFRIIRRLRERAVARIFAQLTFVVMGSYIFSWYFLNGNHILARRLDMVIVLCVSVFLVLAVMFVLERKSYIPWHTKVLVATVGIAFIGTSTYASGPLLQMVTTDEYRAAQYVWEHIEKSDDQYCVLANTWPLLAVEAESARAIIGGGFPVGFEYSQAERVKIFEKMSQLPDQALLDWAKRVTNETECFYMNEDKWINTRVYRQTVELLGKPEVVIGDVYIWRF